MYLTKNLFWNSLLWLTTIVSKEYIYIFCDLNIIYYGGWLNKFTILWSHLFSICTLSVELGAGERMVKTSKERSFCWGCWWLPQLQQRLRHQFLVGIIIFICEVEILQIILINRLYLHSSFVTNALREWIFVLFSLMMLLCWRERISLL